MIETLEAQVAAARADVDAADRALRAALLDGQSTAAARAFLTDAEADVAVAIAELNEATAGSQRQVDAAAAARAVDLAAAARADLDHRLASFTIPPAPDGLNLQD